MNTAVGSLRSLYSRGRCAACHWSNALLQPCSPHLQRQITTTLGLHVQIPSTESLKLCRQCKQTLSRSHELFKNLSLLKKIESRRLQAERYFDAETLRCKWYCYVCKTTTTDIQKHRRTQHGHVPAATTTPRIRVRGDVQGGPSTDKVPAYTKIDRDSNHSEHTSRQTDTDETHETSEARANLHETITIVSDNDDSDAITDEQPANSTTRAIKAEQPANSTTRAITDEQPANSSTRAITDEQPANSTTRAITFEQPANSTISAITQPTTYTESRMFDAIAGSSAQALAFMMHMNSQSALGCPNCGKVFRTMLLRDKHCNSAKWICSPCNLQFCTQADFKEHKKLEHSRRSNFALPCPKCYTIFKTEHGYNDHICPFAYKESFQSTPGVQEQGTFYAPQLLLRSADLNVPQPRSSENQQAAASRPSREDMRYLFS